MRQQLPIYPLPYLNCSSPTRGLGHAYIADRPGGSEVILLAEKCDVCLLGPIGRVANVVGSAAEWFRHPTGYLETHVRFLAEPHFSLLSLVV